MSEKLPVGLEMLFPLEFSFIFSRRSITTPTPSSISSYSCRTSLLLCPCPRQVPCSLLQAPGCLSTGTQLSSSGPHPCLMWEILAWLTRGSGEAQLLACCVTLGKCQPLPPDLLASEGGSLDHVIS